MLYTAWDKKVLRSFEGKIAARIAAFDRFARERFHLTRKTWSFTEAKGLSAEYDAVVVGSDQLWLPINVAGLTGKRTQVCDPTMLLNAAQWREVAHSGDNPAPAEPSERVARQAAQRTGMYDQAKRMAKKARGR